MARTMEPRPGVLITRLDQWSGPCMFWVAAGFLGVLAGYLCALSVAASAVAAHVLPDRAAGNGVQQPAAPRHLPQEPAESRLATLEDELVAFSHAQVGRYYLASLFLLDLIVVAECLAHALTNRRCYPRDLLYCLLPPLRMGGRDHVDGDSIWLPGAGWVGVDLGLRRRVEKAFSGPMIVIGLAVLPLLGFEWYMTRQAMTPNWQIIVFLHVSESVIWLAFAVEFVIMFSISARKLRYCREHWIDIVIICLPLVAFLRILRLGRALRLYQVARVGRAYRLRGLALRTFRGVLLMNLVRQFMEGDPRKRLERLREELAEREYEIEQLRTTIEQLETKVASRKEAAQQPVSEQEPVLSAPENQGGTS